MNSISEKVTKLKAVFADYTSDIARTVWQENRKVVDIILKLVVDSIGAPCVADLSGLIAARKVDLADPKLYLAHVNSTASMTGMSTGFETMVAAIDDIRQVANQFVVGEQDTRNRKPFAWVQW